MKLTKYRQFTGLLTLILLCTFGAVASQLTSKYSESVQFRPIICDFEDDKKTCRSKPSKPPRSECLHIYGCEPVECEASVGFLNCEPKKPSCPKRCTPLDYALDRCLIEESGETDAICPVLD